MHSIICDNDLSLRPVENKSNITEIYLKYRIRYHNYDEDYQILKMSVYLELFWSDKTLAWDKTKYGGIENITIPSELIWLPELAFYKSTTANVYRACQSTICILKDSGDFYCAFPCNHEAVCVTNYERWPFDTQKCDLQLGTWMQQEHRVCIHLFINIRENKTL